MSSSQTDIRNLDTDHVEFYVADADASAAELAECYGFEVLGTLGGREPWQDSYTVAVRQGDITLLMTQGVGDRHPAGRYVDLHGDGVANIALRADDAAAAFAEAVRAGAIPVSAPAAWNGQAGYVTAAILAFGDVVHTFVQRPAGGELVPGLRAPSGVVAACRPGPARPPRLNAIDHYAVCLDAGQLEPAVAFYESVLGFGVVFEERITVGTQAMLSKAVQSASGKVTLTLIQPDPAADPGQIDDFLAGHGGPGIQHIAFRTDDIVYSVSSLVSRYVQFLDTPSTYYEALPGRVALTAHSAADLQALGILADEDHDGQLFQIFARSVHPRRTFFFELIERFGAKTFGSGNVKALYAAVEAKRARVPSLL